MDINEIIDSGLLDLYVLNLANDEQVQQVEGWRMQYPQVNDEIARIEQSVANYVSQYAKEPPHELEQRILAQLGLDKQNANNNNSVPMRSVWKQYGMVASIALLAVSISINALLYSKWKNTQQQVAQLEGEKRGLLADEGLQKAKLSTYENELGILKSPSLKVVALSSVKQGVDARVTVYWDSTAQQVYVNVNNLPTPAANQQYQLWALVDGKPIDAGVMELGVANLQKLKGIGKAQAFAITLEKRGGAISPTLEQMIVLGTV